MRGAKIKHGHTIGVCQSNGKIKVSSTYQSWISMRQRCFNKKHTAYKRYGGRGITICKSWDDFANFLEDMGERPECLTLDRIDNDKGYSPDNCRWATRRQQQNNRINNRLIEHNGKTKTLSQWSRELKMDISCINLRLKKDLPIDADFKKIRQENRLIWKPLQRELIIMRKEIAFENKQKGYDAFKLSTTTPHN